MDIIGIPFFKNINTLISVLIYFNNLIFNKFLVEKHTQDEVMTENKNKEERKKSRIKMEESSKDSQTMLICSLRAHKAKKLNIEDKRKIKMSSHNCKGTDTNCLPQEHHFSS